MSRYMFQSTKAKQVLRAVVLVVVIFGFRKAADPDADLGSLT